MGKGTHTHLQTPTISRKLGSVLSPYTQPAKELARPTSQPGEHRLGLSFDNRVELPGPAPPLQDPSLGRKENQINLEQPWLRMDLPSGPGDPFLSLAGASGRGLSTLIHQGPVPARCSISPFKICPRKKPLPPVSRQVWSWDGPDKRGILILQSTCGQAGTKIQRKVIIWAESPQNPAEPERLGARGVGPGSGSVAGLAVPKPHVSKRTVDGSKPHNLGQSELSKG